MFPLATFAASAAVGVGKSLVNAMTKADADTMDTGKAAAKTRKTADDFERMFLEDSLERLTQSADTEGPLGENGSGGGVWRSMLTREYADAIVKSGGVGISNQVYTEMLRMQEAARGGN